MGELIYIYIKMLLEQNMKTTLSVLKALVRKRKLVATDEKTKHKNKSI